MKNFESTVVYFLISCHTTCVPGPNPNSTSTGLHSPDSQDKAKLLYFLAPFCNQLFMLLDNLLEFVQKKTPRTIRYLNIMDRVWILHEGQGAFKHLHEHNNHNTVVDMFSPNLTGVTLVQSQSSFGTFMLIGLFWNNSMTSTWNFPDKGGNDNKNINVLVEYQQIHSIQNIIIWQQLLTKNFKTGNMEFNKNQVSLFSILL